MLLPSCPEIPRVTPAAWCLLQVTIRALALSDTLADGGRLLPQRSVCDCFNVVVSVFCVPAKTQPHINWLPCADLKITSAQIARAERNLNCTQCYYLCLWQTWWHFFVAPYWWCQSVFWSNECPTGRKEKKKKRTNNFVAFWLLEHQQSMHSSRLWSVSTTGYDIKSLKCLCKQVCAESTSTSV